MDLSETDRLILFNQYEILKHLSRTEDDEQSEKNYGVYQEIVFNGYKHEYDYLVDNFQEDMPEEESQFVWDVLQMYRALDASYSELSANDRESIEKEKTIFPGFDGNDECKYYMYCKFIIERLDRYGEVFDGGKRDLNTHWPVKEKYERMLERWHELGVGRYNLLTKDQIQEVIGT